MEKTISIIIPTVKEHVLTIDAVKGCPLPYELIIVKSKGLGKARNDGCRLAHGEYLIYLDDDLNFPKQFWELLLACKKGNFLMPFDDNRPYSRIFVVWKADLEKINGFDENIMVACEDRDIWVRLQDGGVAFRRLPLDNVEHKWHNPRYENNLHISIQDVLDEWRVAYRHKKKHPDLWSWQINSLNGMIRNHNFGTFFFNILIMIYFRFRGGHENIIGLS